MSLWRLPPILIIHLKRFQFTQYSRRKLRNLVVFPINGFDISRIVATDTEAPNAAHNVADGRSESLYDLYAVVHHLGALSAGHYVASVRSSPLGAAGPSKWKCYNDAQVTDISEDDVVDPSAYILFYIRRDIGGLKLEDVWDITQKDTTQLTEEQIDRMIKQRERCTVS
mmetsp:Transcript_19815/g.44992  ORF Transcript_19815/g.44992 Transcript_19815/m.44992 type:complete len:169 (-) Transcript_19815:148-654(-)